MSRKSWSDPFAEPPEAWGWVAFWALLTVAALGAVSRWS